MEKLKVLILGDGLLGSELIKQSGWDYISRKKDRFDISDTNSWNFSEYNIVVNCIANTDTYSVNRDDHWSVNYKFVYNLINYCNINDIKLVHISTDYVYSGSVDNASESDVPVHCENWYGYTKLLGDGLVQLLSNNYLLCRCTHKPNPFPYDSAWVDQVGNFDYVDVISKSIIDSINLGLSGVYNIGTKLKSMHDLALKTKPLVESSFAPNKVPKNLSMDLSKWESNFEKEVFFSIAIPAYGYGGKGREFLEYNFFILESQIFKDFEVVVSDHSTDDTIKSLCDDWSSRLNIKYFRNEVGRGVISPNLNVAISNCKGKWVKILFQDDYLYGSESLQQTYQFIINNSDCRWLATKFCHTNDGVNTYRELYPTWKNDIVYGENAVGCPSVITIKNENILLFNEDLNWLMDCEYYKRMFDLYGQPLILDEVTVVNRTNDGDRLTNRISNESKMIEIKKMREIYG
jgi:hypothetical protein